MYLRLRLNKSGSTTVYLIDSIRPDGKKHAISKVVKCFGSSKDQDQIDKWSKEATDLKTSLERVGASSKSFTHIKASSDIESCVVEEYGIKYIYESISKSLFSKLLLSNEHKQTLKDIVFMRIANPVSKLKSSSLSENFGIENLTASKIYKMMDSLTEAKIDSIKKIIFNNTKELLGCAIKVMFYDLTTIYFESNEKSDLKEFGFSKDGKSQHVQISLALIVTDSGLPIGYETFKGNTFEGSTLIPTLTSLKKKYKTSDVTIVADSAMLSKANIDGLIENGFKFIVSARVKNLGVKLTKEILSKEDYRETSDLSYKSIKLDENKTLVSVFSEARKLKDEYEREKLIDRLKKLEGKTSKSALSTKLKKPYIKLSSQSTIEIDYDQIEESKKLDGYFGFITNTNLNEDEVIAQYKGLWQVEQSFRITKSNLKIRPVYHYVDRRIKSHFAICYISFTLLRMLEYMMKQAHCYVPIERLHEELERIKVVRIRLAGVESAIITDIPNQTRNILTSLKIKIPTRYRGESRV